MFTFFYNTPLYRRKKSTKAEVNALSILHPVSPSLTANRLQEKKQEKPFLYQQIYFKNKTKIPCSDATNSDSWH